MQKTQHNKAFQQPSFGCVATFVYHFFRVCNRRQGAFRPPSDVRRWGLLDVTFDASAQEEQKQPNTARQGLNVTRLASSQLNKTYGLESRFPLWKNNHLPAA